jgi:hypothetical protein
LHKKFHGGVVVGYHNLKITKIRCENLKIKTYSRKWTVPEGVQGAELSSPLGEHFFPFFSEQQLRKIAK